MSVHLLPSTYCFSFPNPSIDPSPSKHAEFGTNIWIKGEIEVGHLYYPSCHVYNLISLWEKWPLLLIGKNSLLLLWLFFTQTRNQFKVWMTVEHSLTLKGWWTSVLLSFRLLKDEKRRKNCCSTRTETTMTLSVFLLGNGEIKFYPSKGSRRFI